MTEESDEFDKKFSEIVNSDELKEISETFKVNEFLTLKEVLLVQQSLLETLSHLSDIVLYNMSDGDKAVFMEDSVYKNLLSVIYKTCEEFNDSMIEYMFSDSEDDDMEDEQDE